MAPGWRGARSGGAAALSGPLAPDPAADGYPVVRLRLDLSYDGSGFHGWAGSRASGRFSS